MMNPGPGVTNTVPHRQLVALLEWLGFTVEEEKGFHPYHVDVYVPELHVAFEADGPQHRKKPDQRRDERLLGIYRLPVYRLTALKLARPREEVLRELLSQMLRSQWQLSTIERRLAAKYEGWQDG